MGWQGSLVGTRSQTALFIRDGVCICLSLFAHMCVVRVAPNRISIYTYRIYMDVYIFFLRTRIRMTVCEF